MDASVWIDYHQRICLVVERSAKEVRLIMSESSGVQVYQVKKSSFLDQFQEHKVNGGLDPYPPKKAARIFLRTAQWVGATGEALDELGKLINITEEEKVMAKKNLPAARMSERLATKGAPARRAKGGEPKAKEPRAPRESAATMFKTLIIEHKLTDDQIFDKVAEKFGLDEKRRTYVAWYRNNLKKTGQIPADAKAVAAK